MTSDGYVATTSEDSEQQLTFNVKSSQDAKYVLTLSVNTTVGDVKQKLSTAEYASIPAERQRLIYSGRVLKDPDTLSACKIKDGTTVHLVRGAESNQRQNPANQGGAAVPPGAGQPAANVPTNIAAGTGASNPLAQMTGARYAGFHGLPGRDMFGADGGMGPPPDPEQMMRLLDDPNFAQQMNEAMNNPAVIEMLRNQPMIRNNPHMRAMIENPEMRRLMMNPDMIRAQMQMERALGGGGSGGANSFPMPGETDTTSAPENRAGADSGTAANTNATAGTTGQANPFAALFPGAGTNNSAGTSTDNANSQGNPFAEMMAAAQRMRQDPQAMQQLMQMQQMMGGGGEGMGANPFMNPFGGSPEPQAPADNRPPEERYEQQLRQLNDMGFYEFERNVQALRRTGGSVQGAVEYLLSNPA